MILADAKLLLYANDTSAPEHARARAWLEAGLSRPEPLALSWATIGAFLRLVTHRAVYPAPYSIEEAVRIVDSWLARPMVVLPEPGTRYWEILRPLLEGAAARGRRGRAHSAADFDACLFAANAAAREVPRFARGGIDRGQCVAVIHLAPPWSVKSSSPAAAALRGSAPAGAGEPSAPDVVGAGWSAVVVVPGVVLGADVVLGAPASGPQAENATPSSTLATAVPTRRATRPR